MADGKPVYVNYCGDYITPTLVQQLLDKQLYDPVWGCPGNGLRALYNDYLKNQSSVMDDIWVAYVDKEPVAVGVLGNMPRPCLVLYTKEPFRRQRIATTILIEALKIVPGLAITLTPTAEGIMKDFDIPDARSWIGKYNTRKRVPARQRKRALQKDKS